MNWTVLLGLTVFLMAYLCTGAWIFKTTEGAHERETKTKILDSYNEFIGNYTCVDDGRLRDFILLFVHGGGIGLLKPNMSFLWDFPGAFTFAVTVVTTIGYGQHYPSTPLGRGICVVYALIGIPLTLTILGGIGEQFSRVAQKVAKLKLCSKKPTVNKGLNIFIIVLSGLIIMFILPSWLFSVVEGWAIVEALYYCFITLSTIGFGDFIAGQLTLIDDEDIRNLYRIGVYIWILLGLSYLSMVIKYISNVFSKKAGQAGREAKKRVRSHRIRISGKKHSRRNNATTTSSELCSSCKILLGESLNLDQDSDVSLVSISNIQVHM